MTMNNIVISGQAAEGSGALAGWRGQGLRTRGQILAALEAAGLPAGWAPRSKSAKAYLGQAIRRLDNRGYIVRAASRSAAAVALRKQGIRSWDARWAVWASTAATAEVGEPGGPAVLVAELHGDDLRFEGDAALSAEVGEIFAAKRDGEFLEAGEVTQWLADVLIRELGAVRLGLGYYVPAPSRDSANRLCAAMSAGWGSAWHVPLLPVATTDELKQGLARGFCDDVNAVVASYTATAGAGPVEPARAAQLARSLSEIGERIVTYRALCGDATIRPAVDVLNATLAELKLIAGDAAQRFALLELDGPTVPAARPAPISQEQTAAAIAARRAEVASAAPNEIVGYTLAGPVEVVQRRSFVVPAPRDPEPRFEPAPALEPNDTDARFSMIELD